MLIAILSGEFAVFAVTLFWGIKRGFPGIVVIFGLIVAMLMLMTFAMYGSR
ncbi:hypothetical protein M2407_005109 [Serratia sp. BIGb0234]|nr:hypothetical protein [Serratia sp. BIGb0234]